VYVQTCLYGRKPGLCLLCGRKPSVCTGVSPVFVYCAGVSPVFVLVSFGRLCYYVCHYYEKSAAVYVCICVWGVMVMSLSVLLTVLLLFLSGVLAVASGSLTSVTRHGYLPWW